MSSSKSALIGHTGFVGSILKATGAYTHFYNSSNIQDIEDHEFDTITCAGAPAAMWIANAKPDEDLKNIQSLIRNLKHTCAKHFFLISTIAVFPEPRNVDENTPVKLEGLTPYGTHRHELEIFARNHFASSSIARLPALFGPGLKKNALYDLINLNNLDQIPMDGVFQWYNVSNLFRDLQHCADLPLIHLVTEPISIRTIVQRFFPDKVNFGRNGNAPNQDIHTIHSNRFGAKKPYIADAKTILEELGRYIEAEHRGLRHRIA